jgi:hypothetical protein
VRSLTPLSGSRFSIEVPSALGMMGSDGRNAAFASLLQQLHGQTVGPHAGPNLRLGGNSADQTCFVLEGAGPVLLLASHTCLRFSS